MRMINVDCYYKCDVESGTTNCLFVEKYAKTATPYTLSHTFKTLNVYDISNTDFCSNFSSICFINKEITENVLETKKLEVKIENLTKTNEELDISYNDLVARANHYLQERADAQNKLQFANQKIEILVKENQSLNEQLKVIGEKTLSNVDVYVFKQASLIEDLKDKLQLSYNEMSAMTKHKNKEKAEIKDELQLSDQKIEGLVKTNELLRKERDKALSDLGVANTIIKNNDGALVKEAYNNVVLQNSLNKLVNINKSLKERVEDLEMECASKTVFGRSASDVKALFEKNEDLINKNKLLNVRVSDIGDCLDDYVKKTEILETDNKNLTKKIKDIGVLLQTLGVNIESGDDLVVTIEKVLKDNKSITHPKRSLEMGL